MAVPEAFPDQQVARAMEQGWCPPSRASVSPFQGDTIKLQPVVHEAKAQPVGNFCLERFQHSIMKLDDITCLDIDQMIMMLVWRRLIPGSAVAEIMPLKNACFFEQTNGAVYRRNRYALVHSRGATVKLLNVRVVAAVRQNARDYTALLGDPQPLCVAQRLNIYRSSHPFTRFPAMPA